MKVYAMTIMAWRRTDEEWVAHFAPGVVLATSDDDARQRAQPAALLLFPEADGYEGHRAIAVELPQPLVVEGYRVDWQVTQL